MAFPSIWGRRHSCLRSRGARFPARELPPHDVRKAPVGASLSRDIRPLREQGRLYKAFPFCAYSPGFRPGFLLGSPRRGFHLRPSATKTFRSPTARSREFPGQTSPLLSFSFPRSTVSSFLRSSVFKRKLKGDFVREGFRRQAGRLSSCEIRGHSREFAVPKKSAGICEIRGKSLYGGISKKRQECRLSPKTFLLTSFNFAVFLRVLCVKEVCVRGFQGKRDAYPLLKICIGKDFEEAPGKIAPREFSFPTRRRRRGFFPRRGRSARGISRGGRRRWRSSCAGGNG